MFRERRDDESSPSMSGVSGVERESPRSISEWGSPDFSLRRTPSVNSPLSYGGMHTPVPPDGKGGGKGSSLKRVRSAGAHRNAPSCGISRLTTP